MSAHNSDRTQGGAGGEAFLDDLLREAFEADALDLGSDGAADVFAAGVMARVEAVGEAQQAGAAAAVGGKAARLSWLKPKASWAGYVALGLGAGAASAQLGGVFRFIDQTVGYQMMASTPVMPLLVLCLFAAGLGYLSLRAVDALASEA